MTSVSASFKLENLEVSATFRMEACRHAHFVEFARESPDGRSFKGRSQFGAVKLGSSSSRCRSHSHHEVWHRLRKSPPRRRNPSVSFLQLTISRNALRVGDECARGSRTTSIPFSTAHRHILAQLAYAVPQSPFCMSFCHSTPSMAAWSDSPSSSTGCTERMPARFFKHWFGKHRRRIWDIVGRSLHRYRGPPTTPPPARIGVHLQPNPFAAATDQLYCSSVRAGSRQYFGNGRVRDLVRSVALTVAMSFQQLHCVAVDWMFSDIYLWFFWARRLIG